MSHSHEIRRLYGTLADAYANLAEAHRALAGDLPDRGAGAQHFTLAHHAEKMFHRYAPLQFEARPPVPDAGASALAPTLERGSEKDYLVREGS